MTTDHAAVVRALVADADRRAAAALDEKVNKGEALAQLLAEREGLHYKPPSVRAWMRGDAMPPADVLLAVARSVGISIDEVTSRGDGSRPQDDGRLETLEGQVASLTEIVNKLQEAVVEQRREWASRSTADIPPTQAAPASRPASRSRGV
jgi:hypothetical protein